jgi:phenylacetate-CoA ligase
MHDLKDAIETHSGTAVLPKLLSAISTGWQRPFYRRHWGFTKLDDALAATREGHFDEFPVIRKAHMRSDHGDIVDFDGSADVVSSSGTTGRPVDVPLHADELASRVVRVQRVLREAGLRPGGRVLQLLSLNDLFTLGPQAWLAVQAEGACAIRCTTQRLERALLAIKHIRPDFVIGNAHTMLRMVEEAGNRWPAPEELPSRAFLGVAATFDAALRPTPVVQTLAAKWGLSEILNHYGLSELGPVAYECSAHQGLHVHDDCHLVQLCDPQTGRSLTNLDQPGEVVATALSLPRGFPAIRYATGDIAAWMHTEQCACGRKSMRLGPIIGRVDHQLKVFGQTMYPDLLLELADRSPQVRRAAVQVRSGEAVNDDVTVLLVPAAGADAIQVRDEILHQLAQNLVVPPKVEISTDEDLSRLEQAASAYSNQVKIPRFFDLRGVQGPKA